MRAALIYEYGGPEVFRVEDVPQPVCGPSDVVIDVRAASVNPVDTKIRRGGMRGAIRYRLPWILGLDVSGVICEVGRNVKDFVEGDEIYCSPSHARPGCYAERVALAAKTVARKPSNVTHQEAAGIPMAALTAWASLVDRGVSEGQKVLVQAGAGGVGTMAIQLAKHLGAHVATTCSGRNRELVTSLGADEVIDYHTTAYDEVLQDYDGVVDAIGGDDRHRALTILKRGGFISVLNGGLPDLTKKHGPNLGLLAALWDNAGFTISTVLFRGIRVANILRPVKGSILSQITDLVEQGALKPVVDRVFPLDEVSAAHAYLEEGHARGKVIIDVSLGR